MKTNCKYCDTQIIATNLARHYTSIKCKKKRKELESKLLVKEVETKCMKEVAEYITEIKLKDKEIELLKEANNREVDMLKDRILYLETQLSEKNKADQETLHEIAKQPRTVTKTKNIIQLGAISGYG